VKQRCKEVAPGKAPGIEGQGGAASENSDWLLVDCGSVVAHIFEESARIEYNLESLWGAGDKPSLLTA
jgi:ribosomal silencing factor RsfS